LVITCDCGAKAEGYEEFHKHVRKAHPGASFELRVVDTA